MVYKEAMGQTLDWYQGAGVDLWNFCVLDNGMLGHERPRDRAEVGRSMGWAWVKNRSGHDVYIRPARGHGWPVVFLDDLPPTKARAIAHKYASLIVETSRENCQVWIRVARPLSEVERGTVQRSLASMIGADPGSVSGDHFGRVAGFLNRKQGRNDFLVQVLAASSGPALDPGRHLIKASTNTSGPIEAPHACEDGGAGISESEKEFRYALARLGWARSRGRDPAGEAPFLIGNIADRAVARGKRRSRVAALEYAEQTVQRALQALPRA